MRVPAYNVKTPGLKSGLMSMTGTAGILGLTLEQVMTFVRLDRLTIHLRDDRKGAETDNILFKISEIEALRARIEAKRVQSK